MGAKHGWFQLCAWLFSVPMHAMHAMHDCLLPALPLKRNKAKEAAQCRPEQGWNERGAGTRPGVMQ